MLDERFTLCGRPVFLNGANTPWDRWNDFGGGYDATFWSDHYAALHETGVNSSRVWITCNGEVGIDITAEGEVRGATSAHWDHLDGFFAVAEAQQIYVMATLVSFDHFESDAADRWQSWIASDARKCASASSWYRWRVAVTTPRWWATLDWTAETLEVTGRPTVRGADAAEWSAVRSP